MFIIVSLIVLVATFNIVSGLTMLVKNKGRDIAVLRTMGATRGSIMRVFFISGASIGDHRYAYRLILGVLVSTHLEDIRRIISWVFTKRLFDPQVYFLSKLPSQLDPVEVAVVVFVSLLLVDGCNDLSRASSGAARSCGGFALRMTQLEREFAGTRPVLQVVSLERTFTSRATVVESPHAALLLKFMKVRWWRWSARQGSGKSSLLHMTGLLEKPGGWKRASQWRRLHRAFG